MQDVVGAFEVREAGVRLGAVQNGVAEDRAEDAEDADECDQPFLRVRVPEDEGGREGDDAQDQQDDAADLEELRDKNRGPVVIPPGLFVGTASAWRLGFVLG